MLKSLTIILTFFFCNSYAQEFDQTVDKGFLIIHSTKSYDQALKKAKLASKELGLKIDLHDYFESEDGGLDTDEICGCGEHHGYIPRGRWDDGEYISIEYSDSYEGFSEGYYMVVIGSGHKDVLTELLVTVTETYSDAYIKESRVYMGCMH